MSVSEDFDSKLGRILEENQHLFELDHALGVEGIDGPHKN